MDTGMDKPLPVAEAARVMRLSRDALYKRIRRDTVDWEKGEDGRIYVHVDTAMDAATDDGMDTDTDASTDQYALTASLQEQVLFLREVIRSRDEELRQREAEYREESRRKDHLLAAALERIPAIEAPPDMPEESPREPRESSVTASEEQSKGDGYPEQEQEKRHSWWQRFFGP